MRSAATRLVIDSLTLVFPKGSLYGQVVREMFFRMLERISLYGEAVLICKSEIFELKS